jgi:AcrR family transcriptional regulator
MARQAKITDEQILDAARAVFLEEGFAARTLKIAQRAGISEGTIFKRFPTKDALFAAALDIEYPPSWHRLAEERMGTGDIRENLITIMLSLLSFHLDTVPRLFSRIGHPSPGQNGEKHPPGQLLAMDVQMMTRYLKHEMSLGRIRTCDTDLLSSLLIGSLIHQSIQCTLEQKNLSAAERRKIANGLFTLIWDGISPNPDLTP